MILSVLKNVEVLPNGDLHQTMQDIYIPGGTIVEEEVVCEICGQPSCSGQPSCNCGDDGEGEDWKSA
jgi:hypothetical protein